MRKRFRIPAPTLESLMAIINVGCEFRGQGEGFNSHCVPITDADLGQVD